jgi:hypothetical protein
VLGLNEPLDPASVDDDAITVTADGHTVLITVLWDPMRNQLVVHPREPLMTATTYQVAVGGSIADLAGNALGESTWQLTTVAEAIFADGFEE